jgi:hypothetical protein
MQLISKKYIGFGRILLSSILIVSVVYALFAYVVPSADATSWYDSNWSYRKEHTIIGATGAGTDYQIKMTVHYGSGSDSDSDVYLNGKGNTDFSDIRFTDNDGTTLLPYWIESETDSDNAVVWVKVTDDLGSDASIYLYYGNTSATSASNGANTFIFFDDFSGSSLDTNKWVTKNVSSTSQSGGVLTANATNLDPVKIIANEGGTGQTGDNLAMRTRFKIITGNDVDQRAGLSIKTNTTDGKGYTFVLHGFTTLNKVQFLDDAVAWDPATYTFSWSKNTWYTEEMYYDGSNVKGRFDDGTWRSWSHTSGRTGYFALNVGGYQETVQNQWDFALIRKVQATEPANSTWASEELAPATGYSVMSSSNYRVLSDSVNSGGTDFSQSASYQLSDTVGEQGTGESSSANYTLRAGYRQLTGSSISISSPSDVSMSPNLSGLVNNASTGEADWTVVTDSPGGYEMSIKASTNPAMQHTVTADTLDDYAPASAPTPDYSFSVASNTAVFGFSPEGADITSKYKDNGAICGTGSGDTTDKCWDGFSTTDKTISSGGANQPTGVITTVKFRAENGSAHLLPAGTYKATITVTAISL